METSKKSKRAPKPVRVKALVIGDLGVGKYALISQIAWGVEPYISNQVNCTMDNPVIDVQIDISEPPRATTETSSTVQSVLNPEIQHVDSQSRLGCTEVKINDKNEKGEAQEDPSTADSAPRRADIEMAVWRILPSLAEEPWRLNEIYFQHSSVVALCYHVTETETLNNAVNKWFPLIRHYLPITPIVLVGCQKDLLQSASGPVPASAASPETATFSGERDHYSTDAAKIIGAVRHLQCSAKHASSTKLVFDTLAWFGYHHIQQDPKHREHFKHSRPPEHRCIVA